MDGRTDRTGCEAGEQRCDVCRGRRGGTKRGRDSVEGEANRIGSSKRQRRALDEQEVEEGEGCVEVPERRSNTGSEDSTSEENGFEGEYIAAFDKDGARGGRLIERQEVGQASEGGREPERNREREWEREQEREQEREWERARERMQERERERQHIQQGERKQEARAEYARQRQRRMAIESGERARRSGSGKQTIDRLIGLFEWYCGRCAVCQTRGLDGGAHPSWRTCPIQGETSRRMATVWDRLGAIEFADFAMCRSCWAPQSVCHSWVEVSSEGRQRYRWHGGEQRCQYKGVLRDGAAAVIAITGMEEGGIGGRVKGWIQEEADKAGIERDMEEQERERRWFGSKVKEGGVEMSGLCRLFQVWVG